MIVLLRSEATQYSISVRTELTADLPQVMGDRVQLQQVLMNLILNWDRGDEGCGWDARACFELAANGKRATSRTVRDTGKGLPPQRDQIFDAFFTTKPQGLGMGCPSAAPSSNRTGGRLWTADNSPRGATFSITLPTKE